MNSRSADFLLSSIPSNNIFAYDKAPAYERPLWSDDTALGTGCFDDPPCSDWILTDLPDVGFKCSERCINQGISSISGYENSRVDTNQSPAFPPWSSIQNSLSPPKPVPSLDLQFCRVCNDNASGMHFGVMSCEACKSFFRRSIRSGAKYVCRAKKCCDIDKNTRNKCQHCRLQKCINVGMKRNGKYFYLFIVFLDFLSGMTTSAYAAACFSAVP